MIETRQKTYSKPKSEGCHCSDPKPDGTCCNLICFERPNYFCGHLLTDTDLSKEQQYVVEKHKLYNRTLHGWGVVCGLRLTCGDKECCGAIVIEEGYAIDDCGNDLVVCEPVRFDVVSLLKEKGWVVGDAVYDPCAPEDEDEKCEYTQCFYVTICYDEEPSDFTTPFVAGCRPTLTECEPTRIREGVRFDVLDKLPEENEWLKDLIKRLEHCFSIFTTGPFARALNDANKKRILEGICKDPGRIQGGQYKDLNQLFCELRGLLVLYLDKHPDKYNCKLADEVSRTILPDPKDTQGSYGEKVKDAFTNLLRVAFQYAISCALGELVPRCPGPKHAGCVVLGTVEVKGGCVTHVCNCPRKYVWSFANLLQVLIATLFGGIACEDKEEDVNTTKPPGAVGVPGVSAGTGFHGRTDDEQEHERHVCCREFDVTCEQILSLINVNPKFLQYAGTETMRAFATMAKSFRSVFNFTDASMFSPAMLLNMDPKHLRQAANYLRVKDVIYEDVDVPSPPSHPLEEFARVGLARMGESTLVLERTPDNVIVNAYAVPPSLQPEGSKAMQSRVDRAEAAAREAKAYAEHVEQRLEEYIRGQKPNNVKRRIREELNRISEPSEPEGQTARKKPSKRRRPQTPEGEEGENG